jgi:hypothetical protein
MNDHDLETRLRDAYHVEATQADPGALIERVHAIPATAGPERPRWWHRLRFGASRSAGSGGIQVRGASNMLAATGITAAIAALTLGGAFLAVQVEPPPEASRASAAASGESWSIVTGGQDIRCNGSTLRCAGTYRDMSDPRLNGSAYISFEAQLDPSVDPYTGAYALAGDLVVRNSGGTWEGNWIGFADEDGIHHITSWFTGTGEYEGLKYIEQSAGTTGGEGITSTGLLYEGDTPFTVVPPTDSIADPIADTE